MQTHERVTINTVGQGNLGISKVWVEGGQFMHPGHLFLPPPIGLDAGTQRSTFPLYLDLRRPPNERVPGYLTSCCVTLSSPEGERPRTDPQMIRAPDACHWPSAAQPQQ